MIGLLTGVVALLLGLVSSSAIAASFDVFVVAGQSNALISTTWDHFRPAYTAATGRRVEIINCAVSGTAQSKEVGAAYDIDSWDVGGGLVDQCFGMVAQQFDKWVAAGDRPIVRGTIWLQGELDAQTLAVKPAVANLKTFHTAYTRMIVRFQLAFVGKGADKSAPLPFFVIPLGNAAFEMAWVEPQFAKVRAIQEREGEINKGVKVVYRDNANYAATGLMQDAYHYKTEGYTRMGVAVATVIAGLVGP